MTDKLIILDRDGVINFDSPYYIKTPEEWNPIPGSLEAIGKLKNIAEQRVAENTANASIAIAISNTSFMLQFL